MKFLAFVLLIHISALNLVPCGDSGMSKNDAKTEVLQASNHDNHQHQGSDLCSPFCLCHCCHIHAAHFKIVEFTVPSIDISTEVFYHTNGMGKDFNSSILQPPQV